MSQSVIKRDFLSLLPMLLITRCPRHGQARAAAQRGIQSRGRGQVAKKAKTAPAAPMKAQGTTTKRTPTGTFDPAAGKDLAAVAVVAAPVVAFAALRGHPLLKCVPICNRVRVTVQ